MPRTMDNNSSTTPSSPLSSVLSEIPSSAPSSPLSKFSRSPSLPPRDYPSPTPSHVSLGLTRTSSVVSSSPTITVDHEGAPPAKRRRITKPKEPKTTEYLDLRALNESDSKVTHEREDPKLRKLVDALRNKSKIVVIAGAGISTAAGSKLLNQPTYAELSNILSSGLPI